MNVSRIVTSAVVVMLCVAAAGCGGGGPEGTVKSWFNAMNAGKHSEAITYLSPALKEFANMDGGKGMSDEMTSNGTMSKLEIVSTEVRGEGATVKARVHLKDGSVQDHDVSLVKQDGAWKITM